jgi:hypothetical protein
LFAWLLGILNHKIANAWQPFHNAPAGETLFGFIPSEFVDKLIELLRAQGRPPFIEQEIDSLDWILHNPGTRVEEMHVAVRQRLYDNWTPQANPKPPIASFFLTVGTKKSSACSTSSKSGVRPTSASTPRSSTELSPPPLPQEYLP